MKRQGSSSERKRARIPSGKAGAEGAGPVAHLAPGAGRRGSNRWINRDFARGPQRDTFCHSGFKHVETGA